VSLGKTEDLIIILIIVLLLFGGKKIPELARSIGQSAREIRKGFNGEEPEVPTKSTTSSKTKSSK
jgi:sec-independent protein translocase protein TatA